MVRGGCCKHWLWYLTIVSFHSESLCLEALCPYESHLVFYRSFFPYCNMRPIIEQILKVCKTRTCSSLWQIFLNWAYIANYPLQVPVLAAVYRVCMCIIIRRAISNNKPYTLLSFPSFPPSLFLSQSLVAQNELEFATEVRMVLNSSFLPSSPTPNIVRWKLSGNFVSLYKSTLFLKI